MTETRAAAPPVLLWDPLVRITHWTIALGVVANGLLNEDGGLAHLWIGWTVLGLLAVRLFWGLVGPSEARFSAFPPDPRAGLSHLADLLRGKVHEHPSHNPAGALMAYALWVGLAVVTLSGAALTGLDGPVSLAEQKAAVAAGDWSVVAKAGKGWKDGRDDDLSELVEEVHEMAANLVLVLALLHVAGVILEGRMLGRSLIRPMLTGERQAGQRSGP